MRRRSTATADQLETARLLRRARSGLRVALAFHPSAPEHACPRRTLLDEADADDLRELAKRLDRAENPPPGVRGAFEALDELGRPRRR